MRSRRAGSLIARGARPHPAVAGGPSPLKSAVMAGQAGSVRLLLAAGADPNESYDVSRDARLLHSAVETDSTAVLAALLAGGAHPSPADRNGVTPLHAAAWRGNVDGIVLLTRAGADANASDRHRATPLHSAVSGHQVAAARALLAAGANPNAYNSSRERPLDLAWGDGQNEMRGLIVQAGGRRR
jgi:ankyrin repeat protein